MLRNVLCTTYKHNLITRGYCTAKEKWDLLSAVCLERRPVITPLPNEIQKELQTMLSELENEMSYRSDHEIRHELDLKQAELLKKGESDIDSALKETAQDFVDASTDELVKFKTASRVTAADKSNDVKSLNRKLDKHLVLLVNQKIGNKTFYLAPQGIRQDGETMKQAAERVLKESCGNDIMANIYGNAPSGFYKYKYPKEVQSKTNSVGAKVFFYFARYEKGLVKSKDFKWADREELQKILPQEYHKSLSQFLIEEN